MENVSKERVIKVLRKKRNIYLISKFLKFENYCKIKLYKKTINFVYLIHINFFIKER